jgi:predicted Fe-Mo cluster-binding NifX family protein
MLIIVKSPGSRMATAGGRPERRHAMMICIPTQGKEGTLAEVAGHYGRAPFLTLVDTDTGTLDVIPNAPHGSGHCRPVAPLEGRGVDAVVCLGLGRRARASLEAAGVRVLTTQASRVDAVLESLRSGGAHEMSDTEACAGHHGGEGCRQHHHEDRGR